MLGICRPFILRTSLTRCNMRWASSGSGRNSDRSNHAIGISASNRGSKRLPQQPGSRYPKAFSPFAERKSDPRKPEATNQNHKDISPFRSLQPREVNLAKSDVYGRIGEEISGKKIDKQAMLIKLNEFYQLGSVKNLAASHHIDEKMFMRVFISFRRYCYKSDSLPPELHVLFCDILDGHGHVSDLYPFFLSHAREVFPHLECLNELRMISDLYLPHKWYPEAREKPRKIIFHSGPTNSGKTHGAMNRFLQSKSGIYCGPLKLLAVENCSKANENNVPCDLVTGEERKLANPDGETRSSHTSCTVEMTMLNERVEVAVIDEIQMIRDPGRGWAWTRALLGVPADEVHLCGEEAALDLVKKLLLNTADQLEVIRYQRLTPLVIEDEPLKDLTNIRKGDCIVCFNKESLYNTSMALDKIGFTPAIVYGTLPPAAKLMQCQKFNELKETQVLVATDAIGMGLNLSIGRVIFTSLMKTTSDEKGNRWLEYLSTSQCLQIAGRAGRYNSAHDIGYVTTLRRDDLSKLNHIMSQVVPPIEKAGLHPTAEQIELFSFHLPHLTLSNLVDLFVDLCKFDTDSYFLCDMENFKLLAESIEHISLPLRSRYVFCSAPTNTKSSFLVAMFTRYTRRFSEGQQATCDWVKTNTNYPYRTPRNLEELSQLEEVFDALELYLWLSYRFPDIFCDQEAVRNLQKELDPVVSSGVSRIARMMIPGDTKDERQRSQRPTVSRSKEVGLKGA